MKTIDKSRFTKRKALTFRLCALMVLATFWYLAAGSTPALAGESPDHAQTSVEEWSATFGGFSNEYTYGMQRTSDGGYIIVGDTQSFGAGNFDVYLIKADASGNEVWTNTFGGIYSERGNSIRQTSDGGFIIAGYRILTDAGKSHLYLLKTDGSGNEVWSQTFGDETVSTVGQSVRQTSDGGYIIVGYRATYGTGINYGIYLLKTDSSGNEEWSQLLGNTAYDRGLSICEVSGGYVIGANTGGYNDMTLIKVDSLGSQVWSQSYTGGTFIWQDGNVAPTADGGFILTGYKRDNDNINDVLLVKTDSGGNEVWSRMYGGASPDTGYSVNQTSDGGYIVTGNTESFGPGGWDVYVVKTDYRGYEEWSGAFGGTGLDRGEVVQEAADGTFTIAGITKSFGNGVWDVYLLNVSGIVEDHLFLTAPNGGSTLLSGTSSSITWASTGSISDVMLEYSTDNGSSWNTIAASVPNTGSYEWTVPEAHSPDCIVRIGQNGEGGVTDQSDETFNISANNFNVFVTYPNGGESFAPGSNVMINWTYDWQSNGETVDIEYSLDGGNTWTLINQGIWPVGADFIDWTVPQTESSTCLVRVSETSGLTSDTSDAFFSIEAPRDIFVIYPYDADIWIAGDTETITWGWTGNITVVKIEYSVDDGQTWKPVIASTPNTGAYDWLVPDDPYGNAMVRVTDVESGNYMDSINFRILGADTMIPVSERDALIAFYNATDGDNWTDNSGWRDPRDPTQFNAHGTEHTWKGITLTEDFTHVKEADFFNQGITGTIPDVSALTYLEILKLSYNHFSGGIPVSLCTLESLQTLYLQGNRLTGALPAEIASMPNLSVIGLAWNGLYTNDPLVKTFVDDRHYSINYNLNWTETQTVAPADVSVAGVTFDSVTLSWTPILFQGETGGYRVYYSTTPGTGYTLAGTTTDKTIDNFTVTGLDMKTTYYFVVETYTDPHNENWYKNTVVSDYSEELSTTTISDKSVTVTSPNGGETWEGGTAETVTWTSTGSIADVKIEYSTDGGGNWTVYFASVTNSGSCNFFVPDLPSGNCLVRVSDTGSLASDQSDAPFTIVQKREIMLTSPNGGESWDVGTSQYITWTSTGSIPNVKIEYSIDSGGNWSVITASAANIGSYNWTVANISSSDCLVRVSDIAGPASDTSNDTFAVAAFLIPLSERNALIEFYNSTNGDNWARNPNWRNPQDPTEFNLPGTENQWYGVILNADNTHVEKLFLLGNNLTGSLPDLRALSHLKVLDLGQNSISGTIPATLNEMAELREMSLSYSDLTGNIPDLNSLINLEKLNLIGNQLSGTIPDLSSLVNMQDLILSNNQLSGEIPTWLNTLTNLKTLSLAVNQFSGTIPELGALSNLGNLGLNHNNLTGTIPESFNNLQALYELRLSYNQLTGSLPDLSNLTNLDLLYLDNNQFSGSIPGWINNLTDLYYVEFSNNQFIGEIPDLSNLSNLHFLYLHKNRLSGVIPSSLCSLAALIDLVLAENHLSGNIPTDIDNLVNLQGLALTGNNLVGEIPGSITNLNGGVVLNYNGLYTYDSNVRDFLNSSSSIWEQQQTVAPVDVSTVVESDTSIHVSWTPILYQEHSGGYRVYYSTTPGSEYTLAGTTTDKTVGDFTVSGLEPGTSYYIVVEAFTNPHISNPNTVISELSTEVEATTSGAVITVSSPNGGETWEGGTSQNITWTSTGSIADVKLEYSTDNGGNWTVITASTSNSGSYNWSVPNSPSGNCLVKVSDTAGSATDQSNAVFTISDQRTVTVTSPNSWQRWYIDSTYTITWTTTGDISNVKIEYSTNGGGSWNLIIPSISNNGSFDWVVPSTPSSSNCLVKISDTSGPASDTSNSSFAIEPYPTITVTQPDGGESFEAGTYRMVNWSSVGIIASVKIEYSVNGGGSWLTIADSAPNSGSYQWLVPGVDSANCLVRISDNATSATDSSDGVFAIWQQPSLTLTSPNGGESWHDETARAITWNSTGNIGFVKIEYTTDGGKKWKVVIDNTANNGSYQWVIPKQKKSSSNCYIRITDVNNNASDLSDAAFTLLK